jgi:hypothetical protein
MKKITTLLTVVALATTLGLAGCKKDKKKDEAVTPAKTEEPAKTDTPAKTDEPAKTDTPPSPTTGGSSGLADCDAYVALMDKYLSCDKVPQATRDGAKTSLDAMKSGWANAAGLPDDAKKSTNDACKQAADGLKQAATALGCTL